jgi:hypothetical protein
LTHGTHPSVIVLGVPEPYEKLKAFTRGQKVTQDSMRVSGLVTMLVC